MGIEKSSLRDSIYCMMLYIGKKMQTKILEKKKVPDLVYFHPLARIDSARRAWRKKTKRAKAILTGFYPSFFLDTAVLYT